MAADNTTAVAVTIHGLSDFRDGANLGSAIDAGHEFVPSGNLAWIIHHLHSVRT